jgi:hypothetical protein
VAKEEAARSAVNSAAICWSVSWSVATVLTLAHQLRSIHLIDRLEHMHKLLSRWHTASVVRDWNAQYLNTISASDK